MRIYFIDGYNVINSWTILREIKDYSFEAARNKLLEKVINYAAFSENRVNIVYDAHMVEGSIESHEKASPLVEIIYTKANETADSYIERAVNSIGRKYDVVVVSSDSLVQQVTFQRGATRMSSLEFYFETLKIEKTIDKKRKSNYLNKKNLFGDRLDKEVLEKLEKIRRGK